MELIEICRRAKEAKYKVQDLTTKEKNKALLKVADGLIKDTKTILDANNADYEEGKLSGMHQGMLDRLKLDEKRIEAMAEGIREVCALEDPIGEVMESFK